MTRYSSADINWENPKFVGGGTSGEAFFCPLKHNPRLQICVKRLLLAKQYDYYVFLCFTTPIVILSNLIMRHNCYLVWIRIALM